MHHAICQRYFNFAVIALFSALLSAESAASDPADIIQYRKSVMQSRREHIAAATLIIKHKVEFRNQLADHALALEVTNKDTASLFPLGTEAGETGALNSVWSNNAEFQKRSRDTEQKAAKFAKTVSSGDTQNYGAHLAELLDSCKFCHKDFRKKETK